MKTFFRLSKETFDRGCFLAGDGDMKENFVKPVTKGECLSKRGRDWLDQQNKTTRMISGVKMLVVSYKIVIVRRCF